ncbi:MAG: hypothetical protein LBG80_10660 [Bacteroidales bacterium]|jgi:ADP-ribose pyrophosphatase YjhB (NUDIX family)|nr:hypothetical protein [Bacteroidales bacterium]
MWNKILESSVSGVIGCVVVSLFGLISGLIGFLMRKYLTQYNSIIIYASLILYLIVFWVDIYRNNERKDKTFKLLLYSISICIFFILACTIKEPEYIHNNVSIIIAFCFFISGRLIIESYIYREIRRKKDLMELLGFAVTSVLIEQNTNSHNFIIVLNKNLRGGKGLWVPPGGHFTPYMEHPEIKLKNKIYEEIGVECDIIYDNRQMPEDGDKKNTETEWFIPPAFLLKELLPEKCKQNHSSHFDMIYICVTNGIPVNKNCIYKKDDIIRIPLNECVISFDSTETNLKNKILERSHHIGSNTESRNENISRDLIWRLYLTAKNFNYDKK